jgi:hypothetical protein
VASDSCCQSPNQHQVCQDNHQQTNQDAERRRRQAPRVHQSLSHCRPSKKGRAERGQRGCLNPPPGHCPRGSPSADPSLPPSLSRASAHSPSSAPPCPRRADRDFAAAPGAAPVHLPLAGPDRSPRGLVSSTSAKFIPSARVALNCPPASFIFLPGIILRWVYQDRWI